MTQQIITLTVVGTVTLTGTAKAKLTASILGVNSPNDVIVQVTSGDTAAIVANAVRYWLALDLITAAQFQVGGTGTTVTLTDRDEAANDTTMSLTVDNDTCTGLTKATSTISTPGAAATGATWYATLAEFKAYMTVRGSTPGIDAGDDTVIEDLINAVSRYADGPNGAGRRFWKSSADETRYYTPEISNFLMIDDLAEAPTSVKCDYGADRTYSQTLASTDYDLEPDNAAARLEPYTYLEIPAHISEYFPEIRKGVQIVGKFGWPAVPTQIKEAVLATVLNVYQSRTGQSSAGNITLTAAGVVIRPQDVPPMAQKIFESYRPLV
jgi:hypothetical protein